MQASVTSPRAGDVVTIGVFDGVHRGHRALMSIARGEADRRGVGLTAVTFDPHPLEVVRPGSHPLLLATVAHRCRLLHESGADRVEVLRFDEALSRLTPQEFVDQVLVESLGAQLVVVGANFRFGRGAAGDVEQLAALGGERGVEVLPVELLVEGEAGTAGGGAVSSTAVRLLVSQGRVEEAADALTRPHRVQGLVVHGDHRGRELGYPTANLEATPLATIPGDGVYAARLVVDPDGAASPVWPAAVSVGTNPTFGEVARRVEAFALDAGTELDLYGRDVAVDFLAHLRPMVAFDALDALVAQMAADVDAARLVCLREG